MSTEQEYTLDALRMLAMMHGAVAYRPDIRPSNRREPLDPPGFRPSENLWYVRTVGPMEHSQVISMEANPKTHTLGRATEYQVLWDFLVYQGVALEVLND